MKVSRVNEVIDPLPAAALGLRLRHLVIVVRELKVNPPRVYVHLSVFRSHLLEDVGGHDGALDVPAGAALAEGAVPGGLAFFGFLPEGEVVRRLLLVHEVAAKEKMKKGQWVVWVSRARKKSTIMKKAPCYFPSPGSAEYPLPLRQQLRIPHPRPQQLTITMPLIPMK